MGKPTDFRLRKRRRLQNLRKNESNILMNFIFLSREEQQKQGDVWTAEVYSVRKVLLNGMALRLLTLLTILVPEWNDLIYTGNWNRHT